MKFAFTFFFIAAALCVKTEEGPNFPVTPASEDTPGPNTTSGKKLRFCIVDNGGWGMAGTPTKFWVEASGHVYTQAFGTRQNENGNEVEFIYEDTRYTYQLAPNEFNDFQQLVDRLRLDTRVLRERFLVPGEQTRWIAFSMSPYGDLFIREKHVSDQWEQFSDVTTFLSRIHAEKKKLQKPIHVGISAWQAQWWEPPGFVSSKVVRSLRYIGSEAYNTVLDEINKSQQDSSGQPATRPESESEGGNKPLPESEGRSR